MDGSDVFAGRRRVLRLLGAAPVVAALGGFGSQAARAADAALGSVTLVLGDQAGGTRALAEAAKVLDGTPYAFKWANFQGAAPLFEAQRAGAVDLAPAGDLPVLAAAPGLLSGYYGIATIRHVMPTRTLKEDRASVVS